MLDRNLNLPNKEELIYLASLYSYQADDELKEKRFKRVMAVTARLLNAGWYVFSPIVSSHPIAINHSLPGDWSFWQRLDEKLISHMDRLVILKDENWDKSVGITGEIQMAKKCGKPISFLIFREDLDTHWFEEYKGE